METLQNREGATAKSRSAEEDGSYPETEFTAMMHATLMWAEDRRFFGLVVREPEACR